MQPAKVWKELRRGSLLGLFIHNGEVRGLVRQHQTGTSYQLPHDRLRKPRGVVLDVNAACQLIHIDTANAVHLADGGKREYRALTGRRAVLVGDVHGGHI